MSKTIIETSVKTESCQSHGRWSYGWWVLARLSPSTKNCLVRQTCLSFQSRALSPGYGLGVHCLASPTTFQPFEFSMTLLNRFAVP